MLLPPIQACYTRAQIWKYNTYLEPMDKKHYELDDYIQCFKLAFPRQLHLAAEALKQSIVLAINISEFILPGYVQVK